MVICSYSSTSLSESSKSDNVIIAKSIRSGWFLNLAHFVGYLCGPAVNLRTFLLNHESINGSGLNSSTEWPSSPMRISVSDRSLDKLHLKMDKSRGVHNYLASSYIPLVLLRL